MSVLKLYIRIPQSNNHKKNTSCNNIGRKRIKTTIRGPAMRIVNITNFYYFQVINTSNQTISQCNKYKILLPTIYALPKNCSFSLKSINRRKTCLTCHYNCPSKSCSCRTLILSFQIPQKAWSSVFFVRRTNNFSYQQSPNTKIHYNINNYVYPHNTNCSIAGRSNKKVCSSFCSIGKEICFCTRHYVALAQRH